MNKYGLIVAKSFIFAGLYAGIYSFMLMVPIPFDNVLGLFRITIVALITRIGEQGMYAIAKRSALDESPIIREQLQKR